MPKRVRIYTTTYCTFCRLAKELLRERGISFEDRDVTDDDEARHWLVEATGRRTVPQIFIDEKPVGGYEELRALDEAGLLAAQIARGTPSA
jgi:glutaredoxin 3